MVDVTACSRLRAASVPAGDIRFLVVDDQDAGRKNFRFGDHEASRIAILPAASVRANSSARSSLAMNSATLIGFVR
jgi:hypothetical protein